MTSGYAEPVGGFGHVVLCGTAPILQNGHFAQIKAGAQLIALNFDGGMEASTQMSMYCNLLASDPECCSVPFVIDSTSFDVLEAGLKCTQGKCIANSIRLPPPPPPPAELPHPQPLRVGDQQGAP